MGSPGAGTRHRGAQSHQPHPPRVPGDQQLWESWQSPCQLSPTPGVLGAQATRGAVPAMGGRDLGPEAPGGTRTLRREGMMAAGQELPRQGLRL